MSENKNNIGSLELAIKETELRIMLMGNAAFELTDFIPHFGRKKYEERMTDYIAHRMVDEQFALSRIEGLKALHSLLYLRVPISAAIIYGLFTLTH